MARTVGRLAEPPATLASVRWWVRGAVTNTPTVREASSPRARGTRRRALDTKPLNTAGYRGRLADEGTTSMRTPSSAASSWLRCWRPAPANPGRARRPIRRTDQRGHASPVKPSSSPRGHLDQPWSMTFLPTAGRWWPSARVDRSRRRRPGRHDRGRGRPRGRRRRSGRPPRRDPGARHRRWSHGIPLSWVEAGEVGPAASSVGPARRHRHPPRCATRGHLAADPEDVRRRALRLRLAVVPPAAPLCHLRRTPEDAACPRPHQHAPGHRPAHPRQRGRARQSVCRAGWGERRSGPTGHHEAHRARRPGWRADEMGPVGGDESISSSAGANPAGLRASKWVALQRSGHPPGSDGFAVPPARWDLHLTCRADDRWNRLSRSGGAATPSWRPVGQALSERSRRQSTAKGDCGR